ERSFAMTQIGQGSPPAGVTKPTLRRSADNKVVAGVCGGLGSYFKTDPLWFRLGFVVVTLAGGAGILFYLLAWIIMPKQRSGEVLAPREDNEGWPLPLMAGMALIAIGLIILANNFLPWFGDIKWPLALVAAGAGLLLMG